MSARRALLLLSALTLIGRAGAQQPSRPPTAEATALAAVERALLDRVINPLDTTKTGVRRAIVYAIPELDSTARARVITPLAKIWRASADSTGYDERYTLTITPAFIRGDTASIGLVVHQYRVATCNGLRASITYHFLQRPEGLVVFTPPGWTRPPLTGFIC